MSFNSEHRAPKVAILLCTYNGAKYLAEQLDSFEAQTHKHWQVWASDDGSTDETCSLLQQYQQKWGGDRLIMLKGPQAGSTANFMSLAYNREISAAYYAFSDQDDIWENDKLERAVEWLKALPLAMPALYCSRTRLVDEHNKEIGFSQLLKRPPSFNNALMQNIAGGNTMVFNNAVRSVLGPTAPEVVIHDWWLYLAVTACAGEVRYDPYPSLRYRQHQDNVIGMNTGWRARTSRIWQLFQGNYRVWADQNIAALQAVAVTSKNRALLNGFTHARNCSLMGRIVIYKRLNIYRQTLLGNLGLFIGAVFNKL